MNKKNIGCNECGNNILVKSEKNETIKIIDELIEKFHGTYSEYGGGYIDALVQVRESILQRIK